MIILRLVIFPLCIGAVSGVSVILLEEGILRIVQWIRNRKKNRTGEKYEDY